MPALKPPALFLDTTTSSLHLGLWHGEDRWLGQLTEESTSFRYHSAMLQPLVHQLLMQHNLLPTDLGSVVINIGPGSFTGLRTGLVFARTLGQFLPGLKLYAVNAFEVLAMLAHTSQAQATQKQKQCSYKPIAVYLEARRGQVAHATLGFSPEGPWYQTSPQLLAWPAAQGPPLEKDLKPGALFPEGLSEGLPEDLPESLFVCTETLMPPLAEWLTERSTGASVASAASIQMLSAKILSAQTLMPKALDGMLALVTQFPQVFLRPWAAVLPMYLQAPNITVKANA